MSAVTTLIITTKNLNTNNNAMVIDSDINDTNGVSEMIITAGEPLPIIRVFCQTDDNQPLGQLNEDNFTLKIVYKATAMNESKSRHLAEDELFTCHYYPNNSATNSSSSASSHNGNTTTSTNSYNNLSYMELVPVVDNSHSYNTHTAIIGIEITYSEKRDSMKPLRRDLLKVRNSIV